MQKLSVKPWKINPRWFSISFYAFIAVVLALLLLVLRGVHSLGAQHRGDERLVLLMIGLTIAASFLPRKFGSTPEPLADEVIDEGDAILIRRDDEEARVPLCAVLDICPHKDRSGGWWLKLNVDTRFGRDIRFYLNSEAIYVARTSEKPGYMLLLERCRQARRDGSPAPPPA
jgi:hypothetical protein